MTDPQLITNIANGNELALELFMARHRDLVRRTCYKHMQCISDMLDDAVNTVWMTVWQKAKTFNKHAKVTTWLYHLARSVAVNMRVWWQRRRRLEYVSIHNELAEDLELIDVLTDPRQSSPEILDTLKQALQGIENLPEHYKQPYMLYTFENMPYAEISKLLCVKLGTIRSRISRARELIKKECAK